VNSFKILVTGASGHLGYHICKLLSSEGINVRAFIRESSYKEHLLRLPVDVCYGDVFDVTSLKKAMEEMDAIFHAAAIYKLTEPTCNKRPHEDPIIRTSLEGTKNLFRAASENHIKKIVYTSSVETIGLTYNKNILLDESCFTGDTFYIYSTAKIESEKLAIELAEKYGIHTVICNPSTIIGKDDYRLTPSNNMLLSFVKNNKFYVDGGQSLVDVEDVAHGHINALYKGRHLERYIISGENIEIRDLIALIREILKIRGPFIRLNKALLYPAAFLFETFSAITKRPPFITRRKVLRSIGSYSFYNNSKARKELDYLPRPLKETLPSTLAWLLRRYK